MLKYSFVVPYQHHPKRLPLLIAMLKTLPLDELELCIVEVGETQTIFEFDFIKRFKYLFIPTTRAFNRGWLMNVGVTQLSNGAQLILSDADLIFPRDWLEVVKQIDYPVIGWRKLHCLTRKETEEYLTSGQLGNGDYTWMPMPRSACGGVSIIPREVYYEIKGFPEMFEGWGGEDNLFWWKLQSFGYPFKFINSELWHLWHPETGPKASNRYDAFKMSAWPKSIWLDFIKDWGSVPK